MKFILGSGSFAGTGGYGFGLENISKPDELFSTALDLNINWIDTAPIYGFRYIEESIGKFPKRNSLKIISKGGLLFSQGRKVRIDNSPASLGDMLTRTLISIKKDYVDIYMLHHPDPTTPLCESVDFLLKKKKLGLIKSIGLSNFSPDQIPLDCIEHINFISWKHSIIEPCKYLEWAKFHQLSVLAYGLFHQGFLIKQIPKNKGDFRSSKHFQAHLQTSVVSLSPKPNVKEALMGARDERISSYIIGCRNIDQLTQIANLRGL